MVTNKAQVAITTDTPHMAAQKADIPVLLLQVPTNLAVHLKALITNNSTASLKDSTRTPRHKLQHNHMANSRLTELQVLSRNTEHPRTRNNNNPSTNMALHPIPKLAMAVLQAPSLHMGLLPAPSRPMARLLLRNSRHMALNPRDSPHLEVFSIKTPMDVLHTTSNILLPLTSMELLPPKTVGICLPHSTSTSKACIMQSILVGFMGTAPLHLYRTAAIQAKPLPKEAITGNPAMVDKDNSDGNLMTALGLMV